MARIRKTRGAAETSASALWCFREGERDRRHGTHGAGDPARAAEIIVRTVRRGQVPSHLLLGVNAVSMALDHSRGQPAQAGAWEKASRSADFTETYPVELPPRET